MSREHSIVKNIELGQTPANKTQAISDDSAGLESVTQIPIPSHASIHDAKDWVDDNEL